MLPEVHGALRRLLYERGQIPEQEVDVRFEAPTKEWIDALTRPTISVFLFEVVENTELRRTDFQSTRQNGHAVRRLPPRRFDLNYLVSALTTEIEDEHRLLWRTLETLLQYSKMPVEFLPEAFRRLDPPLVMRLLPPDQAPRLLDVWSGLGATPRPALPFAITVPVDVELAIEAPLVLTRMVQYTQVRGSVAAPRRAHIGGVVRDAEGQPVAGVAVTREGSGTAGSITDAEGRFVLFDVPPGQITLRAAPAEGPPATRTLDVPAESYDITLAGAPTPR